MSPVVGRGRIGATFLKSDLDSLSNIKLHIPYYKVLLILTTTLQYKSMSLKTNVRNAFSLQAHHHSKKSQTEMFINMRLII